MREVDSVYRLVVVAAQRSKQLRKGALARIPVRAEDPPRETKIAVEEVKRGLIEFEKVEVDPSLK